MPQYIDHSNDTPSVFAQDEPPTGQQSGGLWNKSVRSDTIQADLNLLHNGHAVGVFGFNATVVFDQNDPIRVSMGRCDSTIAPFTITIYPATGSGTILTFKRVNGGGNAVTIAADGVDLIDGAPSVSLGVQYASVAIIDTNAGEWSIVSQI